jgi:hypothetical protein
MGGPLPASLPPCFPASLLPSFSRLSLFPTLHNEDHHASQA